MKIDFVLFDTIGTVVKENAGNNSLIINCLTNAFRTKHIELTYHEVNLVRGKSKIEAIHDLLILKNKPFEFANEIFSNFILLLKDHISEFSEQEGAAEIFSFLKKKKIKIGLGSGLPEEIMNEICKRLKWKDIFDYKASSESLGQGRPHPMMIFDAMKKLGIHDPENVLKVGDTVADIEEGKNAGVFTAAVLTGTQELVVLKEANPDFIFNNLSGINKIF